MRTTAAHIVEGALGKIGIVGAGSTVGGDDLAHCLGLLNDLCDELRLGPTFATSFGELVVPLTVGQVSRTIGPGQQIDTERPERIELGSFTRVGSDDFPLKVVDLAAYNAATLKTTGGSRPLVAYYDAGVPTGRVFFWPTGTCDAHLVVRSHVGQFADAVTEYDLPTGYKTLLVYTLAERAAPDFEVAVPDEVARTARNARATLRRGNLRVPQLDIGGIPSSVDAAFLAGD